MADVTRNQINTLYQTFRHYVDARCWTLCLAKAPYDFNRGFKLTWSDRDLLQTFDEAISLLHQPATSGANVGVGLFIGIDNDLVCLDIDDSLENGVPVNDDVAHIANGAGTYTEISVSGSGLHLFFTADERPEHFALRKDLTKRGGDFYTSDRFIRLTGKIYGKSYPLRNISRENIAFIRRTYGKKPAALPKVPKRPINYDPNAPVIPLSARLADAGIPFAPAPFKNIKDHHQAHGGVAEAIETECPNRKEHGQDRNHNAVFWRCSDGHIGGRCWHGHCDPEELRADGTSLTKLLFQKIRQAKADAGRALLREAGIS